MDTKGDVLKTIRSFRTRLEAELGRVDHVILFGSHARGPVHEWSDVDLVVVSPAFEGSLHVDRAARARRFWEPNVPVDILCYTPEEFARLKTEVSIVRVAVEEGTEVANA